MRISSAQQSLETYNLDRYRLEQYRLEKQRDESYSMVIEIRKLEQIKLERIMRNIRLDSNKGRTIDVDC
jgi:hypothetical protein